MNFLGKERRGYLGGHPNVSDIHQTSLQRKRLKLENGKKLVILGGLQASWGTKMGERGTKQTNSVNAELGDSSWNRDKASGQCIFTCCKLKSAHSSQLSEYFPLGGLASSYKNILNSMSVMI